MKHLLLYYFTGAVGIVGAGAVDCRRRIAQQPLSSDVLLLNSAASALPTGIMTLSSVTTFAATLASATPIPPTPTIPPPITSSLNGPIPVAPPLPPPISESAAAVPLSTPIVTLPNYAPIFYDDFSGVPGTLPSAANWIFDVGSSYPGGPSSWGNNENEIYTVTTSNIQITASSTLLISPLFSHEAWTSARIETQRDDFQCPPNQKLFVQARIKLGDAPASSQQGVWPAFWALGSAYRGNYENWPYVSEWDIMESQNGVDATSMSIHCGSMPGGPCNERSGISSSTSMSRGVWNTFGFEIDRTAPSWQEETLNWYLNGEKKFIVQGARVGDEDAWNMLAHEPHFLLLNVAVGESAVDGANGLSEQTVGGEESGMEVDYVGVWISPV